MVALTQNIKTDISFKTYTSINLYIIKAYKKYISIQT